MKITLIDITITKIEDGIDKHDPPSSHDPLWELTERLRRRMRSGRDAEKQPCEGERLKYGPILKNQG